MLAQARLHHGDLVGADPLRGCVVLQPGQQLAGSVLIAEQRIGLGEAAAADRQRRPTPRDGCIPSPRARGVARIQIQSRTQSAGHQVLRLQREHLVKPDCRLHPVASVQRDERGVCAMGQRSRRQIDRLGIGRTRFCEAPVHHQRPAVARMRCTVARAAAQRGQQPRLRAWPVMVDEQPHHAQYTVSGRQVGVELERSPGRRARGFQRRPRRDTSQPRLRKQGLRQQCLCGRVVGIPVDRSLQQQDGLLHGFGSAQAECGLGQGDNGAPSGGIGGWPFRGHRQAVRSRTDTLQPPRCGVVMQHRDQPTRRINPCAVAGWQREPFRPQQRAVVGARQRQVDGRCLVRDLDAAGEPERGAEPPRHRGAACTVRGGRRRHQAQPVQPQQPAAEVVRQLCGRFGTGQSGVVGGAEIGVEFEDGERRPWPCCRIGVATHHDHLEGAKRQHEFQPCVQALVGVVSAQLHAQAPHLDAHDRIMPGVIVRRVAAEEVNADRHLAQRRGVASAGRSDEVAQQLHAPRAAREGVAGGDAVDLGLHQRIRRRRYIGVGGSSGCRHG